MASPRSDSERAVAAVAEFKRMIPGLTAYARSITGKRQTRVTMTDQGARTDGTTIYVKPPLALGDRPRHDRHLCDIRDSITLLQLCEACAVRESVNISVYHEIAHITFGSFDTLARSRWADALTDFLGVSRDKHLKSQVKQAMTSSKWGEQSGVFSVAASINEFLPMLQNALEDIRIDRRMYEARPGTRDMYAASILDLMNSGVEGADGTRKRYSEMPLNHQFMVGLYLAGSGHLEERVLHPKAFEALSDDRIQQLVAAASVAGSAGSVFANTLRVLEVARTYGFFHDPNEEEEPEDEQPQEAEESGPEGSDADGEAPSEEPDGDAEGESSGDQPDGAGEGSDGEAEDSRDSSDEQGDDGGDDPQEERDEDDGSGDGGRDSLSGGGAERSDDGEPSDDVPQGDDRTDGDAGGGEDESASVGTEPEGAPDGEPAEDQSAPEPDGRSDDGVDESPIEETPDHQAAKAEVVPTPEWGDADSYVDTHDIGDAIGHDENGDHHHTGEAAEIADDGDMRQAVIGALYFETAPINVSDVRVLRMDDTPDEPSPWHGPRSGAWRHREMVNSEEFKPAEAIMGPALMQTRITFDHNRRAKHDRNQKSGKIATRVLGKRGWSGDDRLFHRKNVPGKRSYAVVIGLDVSGSQQGRNIIYTKQAAMAQAELCHRVGIDFAVMSHNTHRPKSGNIGMTICVAKGFDEPWTDKTRKALSSLAPGGGNLDGHSMQYYRKYLESRQATDQVLMYYTDGKMPAANHDEELQVMQDEIRYCNQRGITLMGVGIGTDSPKEHGLDTVQVDSSADIIKVVRHLGKRLHGAG